MNIYYLQHFEVRAFPARGLVRVHLHGVGHGWRGQGIKQREFVNLPLREQEPVPVTIRRAVAASPHVWKVSLLKNLSIFDGKFYQPVPEQLPKMASEEQQNRKVRQYSDNEASVVTCEKGKMFRGNV